MSANILEMSSMSYVLPAAECDLNLSLMDKGLINGITFGGMIVSAIPWGFIADTTGRKRVLVYGLLLHGVCVLGASVSQTLNQLLVFKFFGGFVSCGPFAVIMSYISEMHSSKHRSRVMMVSGIIKNCIFLLLPTAALAILPFHMDFSYQGYQFHNWNIFIGICALPSLLSSTFLSFFPESPKFLMSQGRNREALQVFQMIYAMNTGQPKDEYPVKELFEEAPEKTARKDQREAQYSSHPSFQERRHSAYKSLVNGVLQLKPMCKPPYLLLSLLVYTLHFCLLLGQNAVRLWLPQIFASITEYDTLGLGASSICNILAYNVNKTQLTGDDRPSHCVAHITISAYINNVIAAASALVAAVLATVLINKVGNKLLLCFCIGSSGILGSSFYFSTTALSTLIISALFVSVTSVAVTTVISDSVNIFPTIMRTMVVIMVMTFGRLGALLGNLLFPFFISIGCIPPFLMVGCMMLIAFILSLFLPNAYKEDLK